MQAPTTLPRLFGWLFLALTRSAGAAVAQGWPAKPVRFILPVPPERHAANIRSEIERWAKVVKAAGIKAD